jgi:hypothetical protein
LGIETSLPSLAALRARAAAADESGDLEPIVGAKLVDSGEKPVVFNGGPWAQAAMAIAREAVVAQHWEWWWGYGQNGTDSADDGQ